MPPGSLKVTGGTDTSPHLLITGATGYLGRQLVAQAVDRGWRVTALGRKRALSPLMGFAPFDLARAGITLPSDAFALIHLAYDRSETGVSEEEEIRRGIELMDAAKSAGILVVYVSSQSAMENAATRYARVKWALEKGAMRREHVVVRLGLVYGGDHAAGLYAELLSLVEKLPILPRISPDPVIQPVHLEDACSALLAAAATRAVARGTLLCSASPETIGFSDFLKVIDRRILRRQRPSLAIPGWFLHGLFAVASGAYRPLVKRLGQYNSLTHSSLMDVAVSLAQLGVQPGGLEDELRLPKRVRRRELMREGRALLRYVGSGCPVAELIARYVRAVEAIRGGCPMGLPQIVHRLPGLIRLHEGRGLLGSLAKDEELEKRLDIAVRLREASAAEAKGFISLTSVNFVGAAAYLMLLALQEVGWDVLRSASLPFRAHVRRTRIADRTGCDHRWLGSSRSGLGLPLGRGGAKGGHAGRRPPPSPSSPARGLCGSSPWG